MLWVRDSDQLIEEPDTMASCHRRNNGVPFSTGGALQDKWELRLPEDISNLGSHLLQFVNAGESKISFPQGMVWTVNVWGCDAANNSSVQTNSLSPSVIICGDTLGAADGRKVYLSDGIRLLSPPEYIHVASYWDEPCPHQFSINTSLMAPLSSVRAFRLSHIYSARVFTRKRVSTNPNEHEEKQLQLQVEPGGRDWTTFNPFIIRYQLQTGKNITLIYQDDWIQNQYPVST